MQVRIAAASLVLLASCATTPIEDIAPLVSPDEYARNRFVPIEPLPSPTVEVFENGNEVTKAWSDIDHAATLKILADQDSFLTTYSFNADGQITYAVAGASAEAGTYRVVWEYSNHHVEDLLDDASQKYGLARVGVGLRITAELTTSQASIDLGSLMAMGLAAKQGVAKGRIHVQAIGIDAPEVRTLFPSPSEINETSIQRALEALATIKAKLGDDSTNLVPRILAVRIHESERLPETLALQ